jgi:hypothetical protein
MSETLSFSDSKPDDKTKKALALLQISAINFPPEIIEKIFFSLDIKTLVIACTIDKSWNSFCRSTKFQQSLVVGDFRKFIPSIDPKKSEELLLDYFDTAGYEKLNYTQLYCSVIRLFLVTLKFRFPDEVTYKNYDMNGDSKALKTFKTLFSMVQKESEMKYVNMYKLLNINKEDNISLEEIKNRINEGKYSASVSEQLKESLDLLKRAKRFFTISNSCWNGVCVTIGNSTELTGTGVSIKNPVVKYSLVNAIPLANYYASTRDFSDPVEKKKQIAIRAQWPIYAKVNAQLGYNSKNPNLVSSVLFSCQGLSLQHCSNNLEDLTKIGIGVTDYNGVFNRCVQFHYEDTVGIFSSALEKGLESFGEGLKRKEYVASIVNKTEIVLTLTSNRLSKEIRNNLDIDLTDVLNNYPGVKDDTMTISQFTIKNNKTKIKLNENVSYKNLLNENESKTEVCFLDVKKNGNAMFIENSVKSRIIVECNIVRKVQSIKGRGSVIGSAQLFISKSKNDSLHYTAVVANVKIDTVYILGLPFNDDLLSRLVDSEERENYYEFYERSKRISKTKPKSNPKAAPEPRRRKIIKKPLSESVAKVKFLTGEQNVTIEKFNISGKEYYCLYDNDLKEPCCSHIHDSFEDLKKHISGNSKKNNICPKCCKD